MTQPNPAPAQPGAAPQPPAGQAPATPPTAPAPPAQPGQAPAQPPQQPSTPPAPQAWPAAPPGWPPQPYGTPQPGQAPAQQPAATGQPGQPPAPWTPPPQPTPPPPTGQEPTGDSGQGDGDRDLSKLPQWAQQQITQLRKEAADRRVAARTATVGQHAYQVASQAGVNPQALLGSTAWQQAAAQLDPNAADYGQRLAWTVQSLLAQNPWMAAPTAPPAGVPGQPGQGQAPGQPAPPAQSGGDFSAGTGAGTPITEQQLAQMSPEEISAAFDEGKLKHLL